MFLHRHPTSEELGGDLGLYRRMVGTYLVARDIVGGHHWFVDLHRRGRLMATGVDLVVDVRLFVSLMYVGILEQDPELHAIVCDTVSILIESN